MPHRRRRGSHPRIPGNRLRASPEASPGSGIDAMRSEKFQSSPSLRRDSRVQSNMTSESIRAQVRKIIASRAMSRSERLARFLDFTVSETLDGHADQLKEFVIGVEVFDRHQDYDPRLDPIVRVEARRLRMKLRKYYETEGRDDTLRIEFPKGSY